MKKYLLATTILAIILSISSQLSAQVAINSDNSLPDNSAMLDVKSNTKGMLVPRMTISDRNAITNPATGLLVFCTDNNQYYTNKGTPTTPNWIMASTQWLQVGNDIGYTTGKVGIGTSTPAASAVLDVASTTKGFLPPRMISTYRDAIASPSAGLIIWCNNCGTTGELQVYNGTAWTNMTGGTATAGLVIGSSYKGGKIAYILQPSDPGYVDGEFHGLIAATSDQSTGIAWAVPAYQSSFVSGTLTAIGSGPANTDKIISQNGAGTAYAAGLARSYTGGGYSDWFLPSKDELSQLYINRVAIGGFSTYTYWSSSEYNALNALAGAFSNGSQGFHGKSGLIYLRAVRVF